MPKCHDRESPGAAKGMRRIQEWAATNFCKVVYVPSAASVVPYYLRYASTLG